MGKSNNKIVKIEMMDHKGNSTEEEFELKPYGTAFSYHRKMSEVARKHGGNEFEMAFNLAAEYFPHVIGRERFKVEGIDDNLKFSEVMEEFFINDPYALEELINEVGFFLAPSMKRRLEALQG